MDDWKGWLITGAVALAVLLACMAARASTITDVAMDCVAAQYPKGEVPPETRAKVEDLAPRLTDLGRRLAIEHDIPEYAGLWLVAQACRESLFGVYPVGDGGASLGVFHAQEWAERAHTRWFPEEPPLDRAADVEGVARVLMRALAWSYHTGTPAACAGSPLLRREDTRLRLAAARVGRGPYLQGPAEGVDLRTGETVRVEGIPRCSFATPRISHLKAAGGVTMEWARRWWASLHRDGDQ